MQEFEGGATVEGRLRLALSFRANMRPDARLWAAVCVTPTSYDVMV